MTKANSYIKYLANWITTYCKKAKISNVVLGISGGVDSAVVAGIIRKHTSLTLTCVFMDISNSALDKKCVKAMEQYLSMSIRRINLSNSCKALAKQLGVKKLITVSNMKPRIRMTVIYSIASELNALVLGTSNADELYLGYFTKFGDSGCDIMPLANLNKSQVYELAKELRIPKIIIDRAPSAGLYKNQTDEQEMGVTYDNIDAYLAHKKIDSESVRIINRLHKNNLHKLSLPVKPSKKF